MFRAEREVALFPAMGPAIVPGASGKTGQQHQGNDPERYSFSFHSSSQGQPQPSVEHIFVTNRESGLSGKGVWVTAMGGQGPPKLLRLMTDLG